MWWLLTASFALPPNKPAPLLPVGEGRIERMVVSGDGALVVAADRKTGKGVLLHTEDWSSYTLDDCGANSGIAGIALVQYDDNTTDVWFGCKDGTLQLALWDGDDEVLYGQSFDPELKVAASLTDLKTYDAYDELGPMLYAIEDADTGPTLVHVVDPYDLVYDLDVLGYTGYPVNALDPQRTGYNESVVLSNGLVVSYSNNETGWMNLGPVPMAEPLQGVNLSKPCVDMHPNWGTVDGSTGVYCVGANGQLSEYVMSTGAFAALNLNQVNNPQAVGAQFTPGDSWLALTGEQVTVYVMNDSGVIDPDPVFVGAPLAENPIQDMVSSDGYLFGGGEGGNFHIVTAKPWVRKNQIEVTIVNGKPKATAGDELTLTFQVDLDSEVEIWLNNDRNQSKEKKVLATTSVQANVPTTLSIRVDQDFREGVNFLNIYPTANGVTGHGRGDVDVDNPPRPPVLTKNNLDFLDGALELHFPGISDADLDFYEIYISEASFIGADFPEGGPEAPDGLKSPIIIQAGPDEAISQTLKPLTNGVPYFVAVRAVDNGGKVGKLSNVISETPRQSFTAGDLAGEKGGSPCSTTPGQSLGGALFIGLLAAIRRRRAFGAALVASVVFASGMNTASAHDEERKETPFRRDLTKATGNVELRYGTMKPIDKTIVNTYDEKNINILMLEGGPQFFRVAEIDFGVGLFRETGKQEDSSGRNASGDTTLTWFPLTIDGTLRAHILDEQVLVPFVRYGFDYVLYDEKSDNSDGGKDKLSGVKVGSHYAFGLNLLLDVFAPGRASRLEAQTGINDSWLTFEWRRQSVDSRSQFWAAPVKSGFDFSGDSFTVGLKLDY